MGKSSNPIIGFLYGLGVQMGLCVGPVDALSQIMIGGKIAWTGSQTTSGQITINQPNLFGGEHKEGGIVGTLTVMMGEQTQQPNPYLISQLGEPMTAFRGLCTVVYLGLVSAMSPYLKPWAFQVSKWRAGWRTPVWEPSLCQIGSGMNAAHILYRAITDPVTGLGRDPSTLDLTRMQTAAQTLYNENFGLNFKWSRSDVMANFVQVVCNHVGGDFVDDPTTGLQYLKLFRADYEISQCTIVDETNIIDLQSYEQSALAGAVNEITVTYHSVTDNRDHNVTVQNLANVQAQGRVISQTNQYPGIGDPTLATAVAMRDLRAMSSLPSKMKIKVLGTTVVRKGDVLAFSWARLNISQMPIRVLEIDRGDAVNSAITLSCAQDVYDVPSNAYVIVQPPAWTEPNTNPVAIPDQIMVESSYRDLSANLSAADLAQVAPTAGYVGVLGDQPPCVGTGYKLSISLDEGTTWNTVGSGPFAPSAVLEASMVAEGGPSQVTLIDGTNLTAVKLPCEVLIDGEIMRCDALNTTTGVATLARGCVDTVPVAHVAGARVWFTDGWTAADSTEYLTGEVIQAKLLTQTNSGLLDPSQATVATVTLNERQIRPYPPSISVNGQLYPASVTAPVTVGLARRDRVTQADQLVDATQADITPESGQTGTVTFLQNGTQLAQQTGIAANAAAAWSPTNTGTYTIEAFSNRSGYSSWQTAQWTGTIAVPITVATNCPAGRHGSAYSGTVSASGGTGTPYTYSVSPTLPAGLTLNTSTGAVTGTPSAASSASYTFTAQDSSGATGQTAVTLTIS